MATACIGIGGNLGDRAAHIESARQALSNLPRTMLIGFSSVHETEPLGPAGQHKYLNAAAVLQTDLEPPGLLHYLRFIERCAGRERREKWGPRTLDLDLLLYDDRIIKTADLTLPHPHMHERPFVLKPLAEIAPDARHPVLGKTVVELLSLLS